MTSTSFLPLPVSPWEELEQLQETVQALAPIVTQSFQSVQTHAQKIEWGGRLKEPYTS